MTHLIARFDASDPSELEYLTCDPREPLLVWSADPDDAERGNQVTLITRLALCRRTDKIEWFVLNATQPNANHDPLQPTPSR